MFVGAECKDQALKYLAWNRRTDKVREPELLWLKEEYLLSRGKGRVDLALIWQLGIQKQQISLWSDHRQLREKVEHLLQWVVISFCQVQWIRAWFWNPWTFGGIFAEKCSKPRNLVVLSMGKSGNLLSVIISLKDALPWPFVLWRGFYFFPCWVPNFASLQETLEGCFLTPINHFCIDSLGLCSLQHCRWEKMTPPKASWDDSVGLTPQDRDRALWGCSLGVAESSPQKMVKMPSVAYLAI